MPLRIAFDLDGVLADMESELVHQAELLFGEQVTRQLQAQAEADRAPASAAPGASPETATERELGVPRAAESSMEVLPLSALQMTVRQQSRLWRHVEGIDGFWEKLEETEPGVVARLATLAAERRWEVLFLTKRPACAGATTQLQSQRWLSAKGFPLPSVYVVQESAGALPPRWASTSSSTTARRTAWTSWSIPRPARFWCGARMRPGCRPWPVASGSASSSRSTNAWISWPWLTRCHRSAPASSTGSCGCWG